MPTFSGGLFSFAIDHKGLARYWLPLDYDTMIAYGFSFVNHQNIKFLTIIVKFANLYIMHKKGWGGVLVIVQFHQIKPAAPGNKSPRNEFFKSPLTQFQFPFSHPRGRVPVLPKFDFLLNLCYNIYIEDTTACEQGVEQKYKRSLNLRSMATNRLKLDFSIQSTDGRRDFVNEYVTQP